ncbi:TetR/AcrR family transcriptional regulator [Actinomadura fibrosa]|uniref:TetR/AcrR family transcriptional regulator n=1 Tax=Actinomadura fibrosa TaxID=111802 RepID=A0ABW2XLN8_9ACTN|nr:TetR/AcrR family transcriptional regulator [Actinomadura fibrosa]
MARPKTDTRQRLLKDAMFYVAMHGMGELSMRDLAAALGTSPRMLIFHFGSKEALLVEIVRTVERQQRDFLRQLTADARGTPADELRELWRRLTDPALAPYERLFFELYGQALQGRSHARPLLDGVVDDWLEPVSQIFQRMGLPADHARQEARLAVALTRGLLLDVLATGDSTAATQAFDRFIRRYDAARPRPTSGDRPSPV